MEWKNPFKLWTQQSEFELDLGRRLKERSLDNLGREDGDQ